MISCASTLDSGTTFHLTIPCERPLPSSKITLPRRTDTLSDMFGIVLRTKDLVPLASPQPVQISGTDILIVEDNWSHQVATKKRLERMGCDVEVAVNGQNAINMMRRGIPVDIVFMDLQMPLLDGFETTAIIRAARDPLLEGYKNVPIVAVMAIEMAWDRDRAKETGMNNFTLKPVDNGRLRSLIVRFLTVGSGGGGGFVEEYDDAGATFSPRGDR
ncbi:CheY-like protein [Choiromyces venosus 120613-1]|uniref:CheY-like protein n=1 Tax=Choiromyces venosus 120613-1 TaxID=1336337 RepID=A0A3N4JBB7_9PEZI|nr:CheY-like protein [Choiromyces venosus 120613-1]